jgi:hypothetical protein
MSLNKVLDMLYRHEKVCFQRKQTSVEPSLATAILHIKLFLFRWFANTIQNVLMALSLAINLVRLGGRL